MENEWLGPGNAGAKRPAEVLSLHAFNHRAFLPLDGIDVKNGSGFPAHAARSRHRQAEIQS